MVFLEKTYTRKVLNKHKMLRAVSVRRVEDPVLFHLRNNLEEGPQVWGLSELAS